MLDTETKRRIDSCRDILVGKVPDPKSQVEQITIALIYKFRDDMDTQAEAFGGQRTFFAGDFARYAWSQLLAPGVGGHQTIGLYSEAIARMNENPGIPTLFRDIFKNAYLPYRDPETLRAFLKEINTFTYDHSERLGDAFEYLLSVLGSQGDAGQFRTPRHIIDFIVRVVNPTAADRILDPACGTAGFLISAYKHILEQNKNTRPGDKLTPDQRKRLVENFHGYDISPDMVRLSLANMYLHGFTQPKIHEYDTLTSEERWQETYDVILANPPFMTPKGGIRPHKRFSVSSNRSEVLFVDYIAEHLSPTGRAGVIVPEGIIFQSQTAYKQLRKMLVEKYLVAVVSLPAGVFQPYSGVKTSILIFDRALARRSDQIAFFKVENDGYGLGAQRREIDKNDLPETLGAIREYLNLGGELELLSRDLQEKKQAESELFNRDVQDKQDKRQDKKQAEQSLFDRDKQDRQDIQSQSCTSLLKLLIESGRALIVPKEKIAANGDYNLSGERYRVGGSSKTKFSLVELGEFIKTDVKTIDPRVFPNETFELWSIPAFDLKKTEILNGAMIGSQKKLVSAGDVILSRIIPHIRRCWVVKNNQANYRQVASTEWIVFSSNRINAEYLSLILISDFFHRSFMQTISGIGGSLSRANPKAVSDIKIPLPPEEVQKEIVAEIEGYQKVIDGARAVLENYRPKIAIEPEWPIVKLHEASEIKRGKFTHRPRNEPRFYGGVYPFIQTGDIVKAANGGKIEFTQTLNELGLSVSKLFEPPIVVITIAANIGDTAVLDFPSCFPDSVVGLIPKANSDVKYLELIMRTKKQHLNSLAPQAAQKNINIEILNTVEIPLPPIETQRAIVAEIEAEQALVNANRELITRMEQKIQKTLARIWGEPDEKSQQ